MAHAPAAVPEGGAGAGAPPPSLGDLPADTLLALLSRLPASAWGALACCSRAFARLAADDVLWRMLALEKWGGDAVTLGAPVAAELGGWRAYCLRRMSSSSSPPPSPLGLLQEDFTDPWPHIVVCLLCSRTSGSDVIRSAARGFLRRWPTPTALLAEGDEAALRSALQPLGLQDARLAAVRGMSADFLGKNWTSVEEFKFVGPFTRDSVAIFCHGLRGPPTAVNDVNLRRYLVWLARGEVEPKGGAPRARPPAAAAKAAREKRREAAAEALRATARGRVTRGMAGAAARGGAAPPPAAAHRRPRAPASAPS